MACISAPTAALIGGGISGVGSLFGGIMGSDAATKAAKIQAQAAQQSEQLQESEFQTIESQLSPFMTAGTSAVNNLSDLLGMTGTTGNVLGARYPLQFNPLGMMGPGGQTGTPVAGRRLLNWLKQTPGYRFTLNQGLESTQNAFAAQGLGSSGAALKGAANYAEGLANTTYNQQLQNYLSSYQTGFSDYLQQNQLLYNMLSGIAGMGQSAAGMSGQMGQQAVSNIGNLMTSGAAAQAAGVVGGTNALMSGLMGAGNAVGGSLITAAMLPMLMQSAGMYSGGGAQDFSGGP